jgi:hypothetical protein
MNDEERPAAGQAPPTRGEPRPSRLRRLLQERPEARTRLGRAVAALLGTALVALAAIGALVIWHLVRRGRLIRDRLGPPRVVRLPELPEPEEDDHGQGRGAAPTA